MGTFEQDGDCVGVFEHFSGRSVSLQLGRLLGASFFGVEGNKLTAEVSVVGQKSRLVGGMFIKYLDAQSADPINWNFEGSGEEILAKYTWLKRRGFPVVPTLRWDAKHKRLLMTDMTVGGHTIVDKHHRMYLRRISITNQAQLEADILRIARTAYADGNGVFLSSDAYAVVVDQSGLGRVFLLDLGLCSFRLAGGKIVGNQTELTLESAVGQANGFIALLR